MVCFKKKIFWLFLWVLVFKLSPLNASEKLLWTGVAIDPDVMLQFSSLNENDIIQTIRSKYPVKVIVLNDGTKNVSEDETLVQFFQKNPQYQGEDLGGYLEPYEHLYNDPTERPSLDEPIIVLNPKAPRGVIMHEFMHYYISTVDHENKPIQVQEKLCSKKYANFLELTTMNNDIQKTKKEYEDILKRVSKVGFAPLFKLEREIVVKGGQFLLKGNTYYSRGYGEEIDIYSFMANHQKELHLTDEETKINRDRAEGYVSLILEKMEKDLGLQEWMFRFQTSGLKNDQEVQSLYRKDLVDLLTQIQDKMDQTTEWYKAHNHEG